MGALCGKDARGSYRATVQSVRSASDRSSRGRDEPQEVKRGKYSSSRESGESDGRGTGMKKMTSVRAQTGKVEKNKKLKNNRLEQELIVSVAGSGSGANDKRSSTKESKRSGSKEKKKKRTDLDLSASSSTNPLSNSGGIGTGTPAEMLNYLGASNQKALKRLFHDLQEMITEPKDVGFCCPRSKHDLWTWEGWLRGPEDTPYEMGQFKLMFSFDDRFPHKPPRVTFQDPVPFHPNVDSEAGKICVDMLHEAGWSPLYKMRQVIMGLSSLLAEPNPQDPLNTKAAALFMEDKDEFNRVAAQHTQKYAKRVSSCSSESSATYATAGRSKRR